MAAKFAREKKVPFFGICLGMQMAVVEAIRNLGEIKNAYKTNKLIKDSKLIVISDMRHLIEPPVFDQFKQDLLKHLKN